MKQLFEPPTLITLSGEEWLGQAVNSSLADAQACGAGGGTDNNCYSGGGSGNGCSGGSGHLMMP